MSPVEATAILGLLVLTAGAVAYFWLKPNAASTANLLPQPVPVPTAPVSVSPSDPGY